MPKSGFDPQRHQRKLHRHNPLSKSASSSAQPSPSSSVVSSASLDALQQAAKATNGTSKSNDIVPLLANLPAPDAPASSSASINLADKVWSLASVSLLLSTSSTQTAAEVKHNRKLLLSHNLVGRLILALQSHTEIDVRREASGALRNLCVDAGIDVRNEVVNKGGVGAILSTMRWASNALGFDGTSSSSNPAVSFIDDAPTQEQDLESKRALLAKPLDKMNKKEKRHATKLATALGKTLEEVAGQGLSPEDEKKLLSSSSNSDETMQTSTSHKGEPFLTLDSNTRKGLIEMAENLVTLVWCLCESGDKAFAKLVSFKWVDGEIVGAGAGEDLSGEGLASWLSSAIALGSRAATVLSGASADGARPSSSSNGSGGETIGVLTNEELSLLLDLALASGNALCALTDGGEADFLDGLLSRPAPALPPKAAAGKKKTSKPEPPSFASTPIPTSIEDQPSAATRRLTAIQTALTLLQSCVQTDQTGVDKLKRYILSQTTMLGVLCAGVVRNIAAGVDSKAAAAQKKGRKHGKVPTLTSGSIFLPAPSNGEGMSLKAYEETIILPTLTRLLAGVDMTKLAHDLDGRADLTEAVDLDNKAGEMDEAALRVKMQGKAEEKAQTLMLALEVLAEMSASLDSQGASGEGQEEWMEDLDASDEEMDEDEEEEEDVDESDDMDALLSKENEGDDDMGLPSHSGKGDTFAEAVKRSTSLPFTSYAPVLCGIFDPSSSPSLTSALLGLARPFESSFPSLLSSPSSPASALLRSLHLRSLSVLNNLLLNLASFSPPPPSSPATDPRTLRRISAFRAWAQNPAQKEKLEQMWKGLFEVAKGCASVPAVTEGKDGEGGDGLGMVETCIGAMWSLSRITEGSLPLSTTSPPALVSNPASVESEIISALTSGYSTAQTDSMRVKCILTLSTLARSTLVHPTLNAHIGQFLISILESETTTPESMVATINGIIDTYADENAHYDQVAFREGRFLERLKAVGWKCKGLVKRVDRRKQMSLRAAAEEAVENLDGFVEYRSSLRF